MRWVEVIRLRSSGQGELDEVASRLGRSLARKPEGELRSAQVYRSAIVGTDLAVHLVYETADARRPDTRVGEQLCAALEEHGITDRSLWHESPSE